MIHIEKVSIYTKKKWVRVFTTFTEDAEKSNPRNISYSNILSE